METLLEFRLPQDHIDTTPGLHRNMIYNITRGRCNSIVLEMFFISIGPNNWTLGHYMTMLMINDSEFSCRDMDARINKIRQRNCFPIHKRYFKEHVEEELIACVLHPRNYDKFEALGFFD
jgi:hypothetical protein